jgi:tRNA A-37 threonylcarbamoyl transferase component Bud32
MIFSEIVKLTLHYPKTTISIVIKRLLSEARKNSNLSLLVELEYKLLTHLYDQFSAIPKMNVVKPIAFFSEEAILVTEHFQGEKLDALIIHNLRGLHKNKAFPQIMKFCALCGRWLRHFQEITKQNQFINLRLDDFIKNLKKKLNLAQKSGLIAPSNRELHNSVDYKLAKLREHQLELVGCHGDFTPWNALIKNDELRVLDFERFSYKSKYDDLTLFLCCLEAQKSIIGLSDHHIESLKNSFLTGYDTNDIQNDIFQLFLIKNTLKCLNWIDLNHYSNSKYLDIQYEKFRKKRELKTLRKHLIRLLNEF